MTTCIICGRDSEGCLCSSYKQNVDIETVFKKLAAYKPGNGENELWDKLIKQKEFRNLKGLIYFTDGFGDFPGKKPGYDTAFVFIDEDYNNYDVPPWTIKLILQKDEI